MSILTCVIDHQAIANTVQKTIEKVLHINAPPMQQNQQNQQSTTVGYSGQGNKYPGIQDESQVKVTMERPMWVEGYDDFKLQPSDLFYDKGTHFELKQHFPLVESSDILLYEKNNHLHLTIKKDKGNIHYSVQKTIPIPLHANLKGIKSYFTNGVLTIMVQK